MKKTYWTISLIIVLLRLKIILIESLMFSSLKRYLYVNNKKVYDINPLLDEYEELLINKLSEIFDVNQPFEENEDKDSYIYCAYKNLH